MSLLFSLMWKFNFFQKYRQHYARNAVAWAWLVLNPEFSFQT